MRLKLIYDKKSMVLNINFFLVFFLIMLMIIPLGYSKNDNLSTDNLDEITKDDIFKELILNDASKTEAVFSIKNPTKTKSISREDIKINFNEVCGHVNSYKLLINSTCEAERIKEYVYDTRKICYTPSINLTNITKEKGDLDLKPIEKEICHNESFLNPLHLSFQIL